MAPLAGIILGVLLALLVAPPPVAGHATLVRSSPPADGLLAVPPRQLNLWFSEPVAEVGDSPAVRLLDESGVEMATASPRLDSEDNAHVIMDLPALGTGTFTVVWSAQSATDGHVLSGTFAFRVGGGRAPGAATVEGETPRPWAVATRWLTFLGAAAAAGGFFFDRVILGGQPTGAPAPASSPHYWGAGGSRRRLWLIAGGALVGLVATLAEPLLQTIAPPVDTVAPALGDAFRALPLAWWLRPLALTGVLALTLAVIYHRRGRLTGAVAWVGLGLGLTALLGLSLTSHAVAQASRPLLAIPSNILHQWSVALWVGGLAHLALAWPRGGGDQLSDASSTVRRFSTMALGLVAVGVGTGVANAGLLLPAVRSLWESDYGRVLLIKVGVLVVPLALATFNRVALRRVAVAIGAAVGAAVRRGVRLEAAAVLVVVLGGTLLAMLAPPVLEAGEIEAVSLVNPARTPDGETLAMVELRVEPAAEGENTVAVRLLDDEGRPLLLDPAPAVSLDFFSLDHAISNQVPAPATPARATYVAEGLQLSLDGWWGITAGVRQPGQPAATAAFYLLLPDPNVHGLDAPPVPDSSDAARAVFERGLADLTALQSVRWDERLGGGKSNTVASTFAVTSGAGGKVPASQLESGRLAAITVGENRWLRQEDGTWLEQPGGGVILPTEWGETYEGAVGLHLGGIEAVNGEPSQIVTFYLPEKPTQSEAWFAWWVGTETGHVHREAMVARLHYMVRTYADFNAPIAIEPPETATVGETG